VLRRKMPHCFCHAGVPARFHPKISVAIAVNFVSVCDHSECSMDCLSQTIGSAFRLLKDAVTVEPEFGYEFTECEDRKGVRTILLVKGAKKSVHRKRFRESSING
jgi:hypothetical protein